MILWSNGTTTRPGITLATGTYEHPEWTANKMSRVLVKRTWADVWTGSCVERLLEHDSVFTFAEVDATPDVIALAKAWREEQDYIRDARTEIILNCGAKFGSLALVCAQPWRGFVLLPKPLPAWSAQTDRDAHRRRLSLNCNIPIDLVEVAGLAEGDRPDWAMPVTVVANKSKELGYTVMRRMAAEPEFLARVAAHGRLRIDMGTDRAPTNWFKENNRLFGLEPR